MAAQLELQAKTAYQCTISLIKARLCMAHPHPLQEYSGWLRASLMQGRTEADHDAAHLVAVLASIASFHRADQPAAHEKIARLSNAARHLIAFRNKVAVVEHKLLAEPLKKYERHNAAVKELLDRKLRLISSAKAEQEAATQGSVDPDQSAMRLSAMHSDFERTVEEMSIAVSAFYATSAASFAQTACEYAENQLAISKKQQQMWSQVYDEIESLDISDFSLEFSFTPAPVATEAALQPMPSYVTVARELLRTFIGSSQILSTEHRSRVAAANATRRRSSSVSGGGTVAGTSAGVGDHTGNRAAKDAPRAEAVAPHVGNRLEPSVADQSHSQSRSQKSLRQATAISCAAGDNAAAAGTADGAGQSALGKGSVAEEVAARQKPDEPASSLSSRSSPRTGAVSLDGHPVSTSP
jgi:hypothetical protein